MLTGLWFSWISKGRIGELAPNSQDLKGWKKHNKDERQHTPYQRSENTLFPAFLQPPQLGLSAAIPLKKLTVIPSSKLSARTLFAIKQVTQIPTTLNLLNPIMKSPFFCFPYHSDYPVLWKCMYAFVYLQYSYFQERNDRVHMVHEVNLLPTDSMVSLETECYQRKGEELFSMCR